MKKTLNSSVLEFIWSSSGDASADKGTIIVWNASTFECKKQFQIENSKVQCLAKHRDTVWVGTSDFVLAFDSNVRALVRLSILAEI